MGVISVAFDPHGDVDAVEAGDDADPGHLRRADVGLAHELHRHEPHPMAVDTLRHRRRRREQSAELSHVGVHGLDLRLEHLQVHLELLHTHGEARVVLRVMDGS